MRFPLLGACAARLRSGLATAAMAVAALALVWLPAAPAAHADPCSLLDPLCVVDSTVDGATDAVDTTVGVVTDTTSTVVDTATDTVEAGIDTTVETVEDVTDVADEIVEAVEPTIEPVLEAAASALPVAESPRLDGDVPQPDDPSPDVSGVGDATVVTPGDPARPPRTDGSEVAATDVGISPATTGGAPDGVVIGKTVHLGDVRDGFLGEVAATASALAFPAILVVVVMLFLVAQNRLDRQTPELAVAAIGPDVLTFS